QLFLNALQVHQAYAQADQPHRLVAPGESLAEQQPVAVRIPAGAGLLQGGLGEVVELEFHEGLADPVAAVQARQPALQLVVQRRQFGQAGGQVRDRKSTRLNSSHVKISYAVFCLKKKSYNYPRPLSSTLV